MTSIDNNNNKQVLQGINVLEMTNDISGRYTGRLLADMGANVIKIESPGSSRDERSIESLAYDTNKRSIVLNIEEKSGIENLISLTKKMDVFILTGTKKHIDYLSDRGLNFDQLRDLNPNLITVSITPFGETGPYSNYNGYGLNAMSMSGLMMIQGDDSKEPVNAPGNQSYLLPDIHAANGIFYALIARENIGQGQHVEVSQQEVLANIFFQIIRYSATGEISERLGAKGNLSPYNLYECEDGWVSLAVLLAPQAKVFFEWVGDPALQTDYWYSFESRTGENMEFIESIVRPFIKNFTVEDFVKKAQALRLPAAPLNTPGQFADNDQFDSRDYFEQAEFEDGSNYKIPGPPFRMTRTPLNISRPSPVRGQDNNLLEKFDLDDSPDMIAPLPTDAGDRPLQNIRVLDFTRIWAGPYSTRLLADYGAEVIKVESSLFDTDNRIGATPYVADLNRNKTGITLDLHKKEAIEIAKQLVKESDLVIDNFALGVIERFGLGYDELKKINPEIIQISMPGWGSSGPRKDDVAFGFNLVSVSGLSYIWGHPDSSPNARCKFDYPDFLVASLTTLASLAALYYKKITGSGQKVEIAQVEAIGNTLSEYFLDYFINGIEGEPQGNDHNQYSPHGVFPSKGEDSWCAIVVADDDQWMRLVEVMGNPDWATDTIYKTSIERKKNELLIHQRLAEWTSEYTNLQLTHLLQKNGIGATPVLDSEGLFWDPQLRGRNYIVSLDHVDWGLLEQPGLTVGLSETPGGSWKASPGLGQDNEYVLKEILGMNSEDIEKIRSSGALA
ncbi:MAG: CaiB/BaiF CoA transferase family protein [Dehalococcoidia bacterium]